MYSYLRSFRQGIASDIRMLWGRSATYTKMGVVISRLNEAVVLEGALHGLFQLDSQTDSVRVEG